MSIELTLMARSHPDCRWHEQLARRQQHERQLALLQRALAKHASNIHAAMLRSGAHFGAASAAGAGPAFSTCHQQA